MAFANYISVIEAFRNPAVSAKLQLSFRSLLRERALVEQRFVQEAHARVEQVDGWNSRLFFPGGLQAAITYNVLRFSGAAAENNIERAAGDVGAIEYFQEYAGLKELNVSKALNDASIGAYTDGAGLAFTFDFDGSYFIFGATPPDWRGNLRYDFSDNLRFFAADPITHYALRHGPLAAVRLLAGINDDRAARALASEDIASFIPVAFADPVEAAAARLFAIGALVSEGLADWRGDVTLPTDGAQALRCVRASL